MADEPAPPPAGPGSGGAAAGEPVEPPPEADRDRSPSSAQDPPAAVETYGIVVVARHVKDDGRELLLYTHRPPESP
jgi:hypothetical protein